jgi:hypothetical protein
VGVVAGDHGAVVTLLEGGVEGFDEGLVIHEVWDSFIYPQISRISRVNEWATTRVAPTVGLV